MRMRPLTAIELEPGAATRLKPGGMHVMPIGLKHALAVGERFPLTLRFEKAGERTVSVRVEKIGAMAMPGMAGTGGAMPGMPPGGGMAGH